MLASFATTATLPTRTLASFGAVGDGLTDDTRAIKTAFNTLDIKLDGENKTYKVNGTLETTHNLYLSNAKFLQVQKSYNTRTIFARGIETALIKVSLNNIVIDARNDENLGSMDGAGIYLAYAEPSLQTVEVKGTIGKGFGIMVARCRNAYLADVYVHDLTWQPYSIDGKLNWSQQSQNWGAGQNLHYFKGYDSNHQPIFQVDRMNEQLNGLMIAYSKDVSIVRLRIHRLQARFDDGSLYPYQADGLDVGTESENVTVSNATISYVWEGIDSAGSPAKNVKIENSNISDVFAYAYKFANGVSGFTVINSTGTRCGLTCFVVAGLSSPSTSPATNNGWMINVHSIDSGIGPGGRHLWDALATRASVRIMGSAYTQASRIRVVNSELRSSYTSNGVHSEPSSAVVVSDLNSTQQNYQASVAATSWSKIASMFSAIALRQPTIDEQKAWFLKGVESGMTTSQIQAEMQRTLLPTNPSPSPTPTPTPTPPPTTSGSCSFAGRTIANGVAVIAYQQGGLPAGYNCNATGFYQIRVCNNGVLSGTYQNASCKVDGITGTSCTFDNRTILHGNSTIAYQQGTLPVGYNCNALPYYEVRSCSNGQLSGSYLQGSCKIQ